MRSFTMLLKQVIWVSIHTNDNEIFNTCNSFHLSMIHRYENLVGAMLAKEHKLLVAHAEEYGNYLNNHNLFGS